MLLRKVEDMDQAGLFKSEMTNQRAFDNDNHTALLKACGGADGLLKRVMNGGYSSGDCSNFTSSPAKSSSAGNSESQPSVAEEDSEESHPSQRSDEGEARVSPVKTDARLPEDTAPPPTDLESSMASTDRVEHSVDEDMHDIFAPGAIFGQPTAAGDMMET